METVPNQMSSISILLVEDEVAALELLATVLTMKFQKIVLYAATDGEMGLDLFKKHEPDIVITDINMSGLNGAQMIDKIRGINPDAKIVVITGCNEKKNLEQIVHYIVKPLRFETLFAAVEECLCDVKQLRGIE